MQKEYVSMLRLLTELQSQLKQKQTRIESIFPMGNFVLNHRNSPLFQVRKKWQGDRNSNVQSILCETDIPNLIEGQLYDMPYPMELEYIKQAGLGLQKPQLNLLNQLFLLTVLSWYTNLGHERTAIRDTGRICQRLRTEEKLVTIDTDTEEGRQKITEMVENIYKEKFEPLAVSSVSYQKKHLRSWGAYPISSKDAFRTLAVIYEEESDSLLSWQAVPREAYLGQALLFAPWILIFYLLERKVKAYKKMTWGDYEDWKDGLPTFLDPDEYRKSETDTDKDQILFTDGASLTPKRYGNPLHTFSYGYVNYRIAVPDSDNDDQCFLLWLFDQVFQTIREQGVINNVSQISVEQLSKYIKEPDDEIQKLGKICVCLNQKKLIWESKEETVDGGTKISN